MNFWQFILRYVEDWKFLHETYILKNTKSHKLFFEECFPLCVLQKVNLVKWISLGFCGLTTVKGKVAWRQWHSGKFFEVWFRCGNEPFFDIFTDIFSPFSTNLSWLLAYYSIKAQLGWKKTEFIGENVKNFRNLVTHSTVQEKGGNAGGKLDIHSTWIS